MNAYSAEQLDTVDILLGNVQSNVINEANLNRLCVDMFNTFQDSSWAPEFGGRSVFRPRKKTNSYCRMKRGV